MGAFRERPLLGILWMTRSGCRYRVFATIVRFGGEHWVSRFSFESEDSLENRNARESRGTASVGDPFELPSLADCDIAFIEVLSRGFEFRARGLVFSGSYE